MPTCSLGHESAADDYCDVCGRPVAPARAEPAPEPAGREPAGRAAAGREPAAGPPVALAPCAVCAVPMTGRFCEACGHDSLAPPPDPPPPLPPPSASPDPPAPPAEQPPAPPVVPEPGAVSWTWVLVAAADREYFDAVKAMHGPDAAAVEFPDDRGVRSFPLGGEQILIGRRRADAQVDLTGPPEDFGVSHRHARLLAQPGGSWAIEDLGSTNGTRVNSYTSVLKARTRVPVGPGDRIYLGAWTRLTLHAPERPPC